MRHWNTKVPNQIEANGKKTNETFVLLTQVNLCLVSPTLCGVVKGYLSRCCNAAKATSASMYEREAG